jgi:hypothetical protein
MKSANGIAVLKPPPARGAFAHRPAGTRALSSSDQLSTM